MKNSDQITDAAAHNVKLIKKRSVDTGLPIHRKWHRHNFLLTSREKNIANFQRFHKSITRIFFFYLLDFFQRQNVSKADEN